MSHNPGDLYLTICQITTTQVVYEESLWLWTGTQYLSIKENTLMMLVEPQPCDYGVFLYEDMFCLSSYVHLTKL